MTKTKELTPENLLSTRALLAVDILIAIKNTANNKCKEEGKLIVNALRFTMIHEHKIPEKIADILIEKVFKTDKVDRDFVMNAMMEIIKTDGEKALLIPLDDRIQMVAAYTEIFVDSIDGKMIVFYDKKTKAIFVTRKIGVKIGSLVEKGITNDLALPSGTKVSSAECALVVANMLKNVIAKNYNKKFKDICDKDSCIELSNIKLESGIADERRSCGEKWRFANVWVTLKIKNITEIKKDEIKKFANVCDKAEETAKTFLEMF